MGTSYTIIVNGKEVEKMLASSPLEAIKTYAMVNADEWFYFQADTVSVVSSKRIHVYRDVEYVCDDNSMYANDTKM